MSNLYNHKCSSCGRTWGTFEKSLECPFCHEAKGIICEEDGRTLLNYDAESSDEIKYDNIDGAMKYIFDEYGREIINKKDIFISLLSDYAPGLRKQRDLIRLAVEKDVYSDILKSDCTDARMRKNEIRKAVKMLTDQGIMNKSDAEKTVKWFAKQLGWLDSNDRISYADETASSVEIYYSSDLPPKKWDRVRLGKYKYYRTGNIKEIEWDVLAVEGGKVLLWSVNCLDAQRYNDGLEKKCDWENSDLREWLNSVFANDAFSEEEREIIEPCKNRKSKNPRSNIFNGRDDVDDGLFIISNEQLMQYIDDADKHHLISKATPFVRGKGGYYDSQSLRASWWVRTPGLSDISAMFVKSDGRKDEPGAFVTDECYGVRPALWVRWDDLMELQAENASDQ